MNKGKISKLITRYIFNIRNKENFSVSENQFVSSLFRHIVENIGEKTTKSEIKPLIKECLADYNLGEDVDKVFKIEYFVYQGDDQYYFSDEEIKDARECEEEPKNHIFIEEYEEGCISIGNEHFMPLDKLLKNYMFTKNFLKDFGKDSLHGLNIELNDIEGHIEKLILKKKEVANKIAKLIKS